jgi:hypothetical protein
MRLNSTQPTRVAWVASLVFAVAACAGKELLDLGGDGGQAPHGSDGAVSAESSLSSSGAGQEGGTSGSGGSSGSSGSSGSGGGLTDGAIVPSNAFPCGSNVCSGSDVCCEPLGLAPTCQATGQCDGPAIGCTSATCPAGARCCVFLQDAGPSNYSVSSTECIATTACPTGTLQACDEFGSVSGCPPNYACFGSLVPSCLGPYGPYDGGAE